MLKITGIMCNKQDFQQSLLQGRSRDATQRMGMWTQTWSGEEEWEKLGELC